MEATNSTYTIPGSDIKVRVRSERRYVLVRWQDRGPVKVVKRSDSVETLLKFWLRGSAPGQLTAMIDQRTGAVTLATSHARTWA